MVSQFFDCTVSKSFFIEHTLSQAGRDWRNRRGRNTAGETPRAKHRVRNAAGETPRAKQRGRNNRGRNTAGETPAGETPPGETTAGETTACRSQAHTQKIFSAKLLFLANLNMNRALNSGLLPRSSFVEYYKHRRSCTLIWPLSSIILTCPEDSSPGSGPERRSRVATSHWKESLEKQIWIWI